MKKEVTIIIYVILFLVVAMSFCGCAGFRGYVLIRDNPTDKVTIKENGIFQKKPIYGKGCDFYANRECDFEYSVDKDGKITYKFSSKKDSFFTKLLGGWKILKPDNVNMGGK